MGIASVSNILAPALGPVAGGILCQWFGWRAVFWFLAGVASVFFVGLVLFLPETARGVVGDGSGIGSRSRSRWNVTGWRLIFPKKSGERQTLDPTAIATAELSSRKRWIIPNPWSSLRLLFCRPVGLVLFANGVIFGSYYSVTAGIPAKFEELYRLNDFEIGLCFIPAGLGCLLSAVLNGFVVDWNYHRLSKDTAESSIRRIKHDILLFPVERARLQICIPMAVGLRL